MWLSGFSFLILSVIFEVYLCWHLHDLSDLFKWENLHNWWLTKYFFAPLCEPGRTHLDSLKLTGKEWGPPWKTHTEGCVNEGSKELKQQPLLLPALTWKMTPQSFIVYIGSIARPCLYQPCKTDTVLWLMFHRHQLFLSLTCLTLLRLMMSWLKDQRGGSLLYMLLC